MFLSLPNKETGAFFLKKKNKKKNRQLCLVTPLCPPGPRPGLSGAGGGVVGGTPLGFPYKGLGSRSHPVLIFCEIKSEKSNEQWLHRKREARRRGSDKGPPPNSLLPVLPDSSFPPVSMVTTVKFLLPIYSFVLIFHPDASQILLRSCQTRSKK